MKTKFITVSTKARNKNKKPVKMKININKDIVNLETFITDKNKHDTLANDLVLNLVNNKYDKKLDMFKQALPMQRKNETHEKNRLAILKSANGYKFISDLTYILKASPRKRVQAYQLIAETTFFKTALNVSIRALSDAIKKVERLTGVKKDLTNNKILANLKTNKSKKVAKKNTKKATANNTPVLSDVLVKSIYDVIKQVKLILPKLKNNKKLSNYINALEGNTKIATKK